MEKRGVTLEEVTEVLDMHVALLESLSALFDSLERRVAKLEQAQETVTVTSPVVTDSEGKSYVPLSMLFDQAEP